MSSPQQDSVTQSWLRIDATELARRRAIGRKMLYLLVAQAAQTPLHQTVSGTIAWVTIFLRIYDKLRYLGILTDEKECCDIWNDILATEVRKSSEKQVVTMDFDD
jgi:hypothetical protein